MRLCPPRWGRSNCAYLRWLRGMHHGERRADSALQTALRRLADYAGGTSARAGGANVLSRGAASRRARHMAGADRPAWRVYRVRRPDAAQRQGADRGTAERNAGNHPTVWASAGRCARPWRSRRPRSHRRQRVARLRPRGASSAYAIRPAALDRRVRGRAECDRGLTRRGIRHWPARSARPGWLVPVAAGGRRSMHAAWRETGASCRRRRRTDSLPAAARRATHVRPRLGCRVPAGPGMTGRTTSQARRARPPATPRRRGEPGWPVRARRARRGPQAPPQSPDREPAPQPRG